MDRGTARLLIVVALAIVGGLVLANGFETSAPSASPSPGASPSESLSPSPGASPSTQAPDAVEPQAPEEVKFMALNGTTVTGAGAAAQDDMVEAGYVVARDAADSPVQGVQTTSVWYRSGDTEEETAQNRANAKQIAKKIFKGAEFAPLSNDYDDIVPPAATIVVVVGQDYADTI